MAARITYTPHLKLRISSELSADSKYNLEKIDELATTFTVDTTDTLKIRCQGDILIEPNSPDLGGSGTGGAVSIGSVDRPASQINLHGPVNFAGGFTVTDYLTLNGDPYSTTISRNLSQTEDLTFTLPMDYGSVGQFLSSDGSGGMVWNTTPIGTGTVKQLNTYWSNADGNTFTLVHGLGTVNLTVLVKDADTNEVITIQSARALNVNTMQLIASEAPEDRWLVILQGEW